MDIKKMLATLDESDIKTLKEFLGATEPKEEELSSADLLDAIPEDS